MLHNQEGEWIWLLLHQRGSVGSEGGVGIRDQGGEMKRGSGQEQKGLLRRTKNANSLWTSSCIKKATTYVRVMYP